MAQYYIERGLAICSKCNHALRQLDGKVVCPNCNMVVQYPAPQERVEAGCCKCGHKMHKLLPPHECWQHEVGTCKCLGFEGSDGQPFDQEYYRGGKRHDHHGQNPVLPHAT